MIANKIVAKKLWAVRHEGGEHDLHDCEMLAQHAVELAEESNLAASMNPVYILPADPMLFEKMALQIAKDIDGLAFHVYKEGECLPRGHEMDSVEKVNEVQGFRQRSAISKARIALKSLGLAP